MTDRIVEVAETPARLSLEHGCLRIEGSTCSYQRVPLEDLAMVILSFPQAQVSAALLQALAVAGVGVLVCDDKHLPAGMMLPLQMHHLQSERVAAQAAAPAPLRKRLWQQIVKAKINTQSRLLHRLGGADGGLAILATQVKSGDPGNLEAQAARKYWPLLFGDPGFRRDREAKDQNRHLNYGYAVVRAQVARALCASGLHPALGLMHHNRYDAFPLADDLMEPYRAHVDEAVATMPQTWGNELTREVRQRLLSVLQSRVRLGGEDRDLADAILRGAQSLAACFRGEGRRLAFPDAP